MLIVSLFFVGGRKSLNSAWVICAAYPAQMEIERKLKIFILNPVLFSNWYESGVAISFQHHPQTRLDNSVEPFNDWKIAFSEFFS